MKAFFLALARTGEKRLIVNLSVIALVFASAAQTTVAFAQQRENESGVNGEMSSPALRVNQTGSSALDESAKPKNSDERYRIGPGDLLDVRIFNKPQFSRDSVRVDNRGMIRMPLIEGDLRAACRTEGELAREIASNYLKYLRNPQVEVFVKEYQSQLVSVLGAVKSPGRFQLQRRVRLLELITLVNGPTDLAGRSVQIVQSGYNSLCDQEGAEKANDGEADGIISYKLSDTLLGKPEANPYMHSGDVITIPEAEQILIVGNVLKPSALPLKDPLTLTRAIALAGGTLPDTKSNKIRIIRQAPGSTAKTEIIADLKAIDTQKTTDIVMQANDIIEVPRTTGGRMIMKDLLRTIIPTASQLPLRIVY